MPNDAKIGLVVGVGLVIAVAVLYFHKAAPADSQSGDPAPAGIVRPIPPAPLPSSPAHTTAAQPTAIPSDAPSGPRRHTVREGDTLFSLARLYYSDPERFNLIYQANRGVLHEPDSLPVGAELVIPELPGASQNP
jgi:nucleoid-associated protein YgaU